MIVRLCILNTHLFRRQTIYVGIVGFTILIWDHLVTSGDEIEFIWHGRKAIHVYLFLLNRYLTPLGFIVNLVAYNLPSWSSEVSFDVLCSLLAINLTNLTAEHFVRYEGAMTAIGIEIVGIMMLLRVIAMYRHQRATILLAVLLLLAWIVVTAWLLIHAGRFTVRYSFFAHDNLAYAFTACTMVFNSGSIASASAWFPLLYDTYVFGLTLNRTLPAIRNKEAGRIIHTLFADGLLYYSVICTVNLVLAIMIIRAPVGVKNIAAQLELVLTVTMMSRITLNIKKQAYYRPSPLHSQAENIMMSTRNLAISTPSGVVVLDQLRPYSVSSAARVELGNRARSGSTSPLAPPVRAISFAENPSFSAIRGPRLSAIYPATEISATQGPVNDSPVVDWRSASNYNERNTADFV
ncbi:hypothetical protein BDR04DRAFT_1151167 [Suillus decipiens]|nr:hypothetical protein BDR04DRAFT_1151167 [Suillus decipiens]